MADRVKDEVRIRELMAERQSAMRARDAERVVAGCAPEVVIFDLAPPLRRVTSAVDEVEALRQWFATFDDTFDFEIRDLAVTVDGDVAFCHSLNRMGTREDGPEQFQLWFRATYGLRRLDGEWRITHLHESSPFHMDGSFTAATELRP
jgi:ketosteroid isomerase-like protein